MSDEAAIANLVHAYAERIDLGDFEGVADLLADAEVSAVGAEAPIRGRDAVLALYRGSVRLHGGSPGTKHVTTNLIVEIGSSGDTATCRSYFTVLQAVPGELSLQPIIAGRYHDRFTRGPDGWSFGARHMIVDLVGDLSRHLLFPLPGE